MSERRRAEEETRRKHEAKRVAFFEQYEEEWWKAINAGIFHQADVGENHLCWWPWDQSGALTQVLLEALAKRLEIEVPGIYVRVDQSENPNTDLPSDPYYSLLITW